MVQVCLPIRVNLEQFGFLSQTTKYMALTLFGSAEDECPLIKIGLNQHRMAGRLQAVHDPSTHG